MTQSQNGLNCLPPTLENVSSYQTKLKFYYDLYNFYFFGAPLPADFPPSIQKQFPNRSYKAQLKAAIVATTNEVDELVSLQREYLTDYYALYMHYSYSTALPKNFMQCILQQFPNKSYKAQLKAAIATLQGIVNQEEPTAA